MINWNNTKEVKKYHKKYNAEWYKNKKTDPAFIQKRKKGRDLWEIKNLEKRRQQNKIWRENNKEHLKQYMINYKKNNYNKINKRRKEIRLNTKNRVLLYYGKGEIKCDCCGENKFEFLTIDHINGNGNKHRKEIKKLGTDFYRWLESNGFPEGYMVLCYNCNCSKGHYGYCPHKNSYG